MKLPVGGATHTGSAILPHQRHATEAPIEPLGLSRFTTTWSTTMRKFLAACRQPDALMLDDLIGVVGLFVLIPIVLSLGGAK